MSILSGAPTEPVTNQKRVGDALYLFSSARQELRAYAVADVRQAPLTAMDEGRATAGAGLCRVTKLGIR